MAGRTGYVEGVEQSTTGSIAEGAIRVRGARVHNLRNVDLDIPRERLVVITGVSGSGKSSLAFDTLFAEGQRRYLQSLSTYTRQFLNQLERPDIDLIDGLPPTISVDQRVGAVQLRSTLATTTELYDYLRLLYARAGHAHCPECGRPVSQQSSQTIVERILALEERRKVMILAPLVRGRRGQHRDVFEKIVKEGFVRARVDGEVIDATEIPALSKNRPHDIEAIIDRIIVKDGIRSRLQESVDLALKHGNGACLISDQQDGRWNDRLYSSRFACPDCDVNFPELEPRTFSFNSPYGACMECEGLGYCIDRDRKGRGAKRQTRGKRFDESTNSIFETAQVCPECRGARLGPIARAVTLAGRTLPELTALTIREAAAAVDQMVSALESKEDSGIFSAEGRLAAKRALPGIASRLRYLQKVGLDYLTLDRPTRTLSGGEFQRARLAGCLGAGLIGVCYILDEPTIGLHPRDTGRLIEILTELRDRGNTVIVVEHDGDMMRQADYLIDLGPGAGHQGGKVVASGSPERVSRESHSLTGRFLKGDLEAVRSRNRRPVSAARTIRISGARLHNLKQVDVEIPLGVLTCVTGVSGSGKSSLITHTLVPAIQRTLMQESCRELPLDRLEGSEHIDRILQIDQSPIGRTGRSNPATFSGVWDQIRRLFARTRDARLRGYTARRFSFNAGEGRCPECAGQGTKRIEMHFLPDVYVNCPVCRGERFNQQTLGIRFRGNTVADVLRMRIDEAAEFFKSVPKAHTILRTFTDVGLGYLELGQSSLTLSGGEAQRIKLATELSRSTGNHTLFILDEPTTGLHPCDVERLLGLLQKLVDEGNSVLVIEHQLDMISAADWIIDLGPEGGAAGGMVVATGTPEDMAGVAESHTAISLHNHFQRQRPL